MHSAPLIATALCAAFLSLGGHAYAQGIQVSPVVIDVPPNRGVTSFRMQNLRDRDVSFEVDAYVWTQDNGDSVLTPTTDVIVAPSVFLMNPGHEQIVRLAVSPAARGGDVERSYRLLVRELPSAAAAPGFRLQLEMSMPVFLRPPNARGELSVRRVQGDDGRPAVMIANTGAAHLYLSEPTSADTIENLPRYLLAGAQITRPLAPGALRLMVAQAGAASAEERRFEFDDAAVLASRR